MDIIADSKKKRFEWPSKNLLSKHWMNIIHLLVSWKLGKLCQIDKNESMPVKKMLYVFLKYYIW